MVPSKQPILALAKIDDGARHRIVAAGLRGVILISDDGGKAWRQARVPVQSDLLSLSFPTAQEGWAVGHDGVILHSGDGGATWQKQFDGNQAQAALPAYYKTRIDSGDKQLQGALDEVALNMKNGPTLPFLSVYFEDASTGYAVGSFGMIVETEDGGKTWRPWLDHVENPNYLNLNDIRKIGADIYIAGEQGTVYWLDRKQKRFVSISTTYKGSFFRIVGSDRYLLVMGLNGTAFRSADNGKHWEAVTTGVHASLTSAALSADGKALILATEGGQALSSHDDARTFSALRVSNPMMFADVVAGNDGEFVFGGNAGIDREQADPITSRPLVQK